MKTSLKIAAVVLTFAPGMAVAQSGVADPAVPGSGYQIPQTPRTGTPSLSADPVDLSKPGSGYQIPTASPTDAAKERPTTDRK